MQNERSVDGLQRRYRKLVERLGKTPLILRGTITKRTIAQSDRKHPERRKTYGPYYQWTFKERGKTITLNLTASQATLYQRAIDNNRRMKRTLRQMQEMSLRILEATTTSVKRRKLPKRRGLRLS